MARTADRAAELSIRSALGASRARLTQQLLTECLLLSLVASVAGLLVAFWTTSIATRFTATNRRTALFHPGCPRPGFRVIVIHIQRPALRRLASTVCAPPLLVRNPWVQQGPRRATDSRSLGWRAGDAHDYSSHCIGVRWACVCAPDGKRPRYDVQGVATVSVSLEGTAHQLEERQLPLL